MTCDMHIESTSPEMRIESTSPEMTAEIGRALGRLVQRPVIIALIGDLGSGKTVFVQGLARGLEVPDDYIVVSPSYTLVHEYPGRLPLYHVDLYRLGGVDDLESIGLDDILAGEGVLAVEWADRSGRDCLDAGLCVRLDCLEAEQRRLAINGLDERGRKLATDLSAIAKEKKWL